MANRRFRNRRSDDHIDMFHTYDLPILSQLSRSVDPPEKEAMSILHPSFERYTQLQEQHTPAEASHMVSSV